ncbi:hypothetical protein SISNIDRAFT_443933 [Sistotremastrum niveocremeum HHB9708]|uniref:Cation/H+ exchanger transmembrane domain-containing protein n=1 Tax=Sistotremastrum niveocremeum HHB9708 TaxID=1314777 RepID=A0A164RDN6_9AGAM|nr:hypothetical protein SISNIDRAFT_443933 [Sistotremastrum niveocremeum HHB9708]
MGIIVTLCQLLALAFKKIRQPKVIAEVIAGIILGPTAMGRVPGFTQHIFPQQSVSYLSLTANIGLVLFLFLVGLEIDTTIVRRNARISGTIATGMILSFGIGAGMSKPLYDHFINPSTSYGHFLLFTGVSYSITAFPVLCRILTALNLLDTRVGLCVLSAGVANDVIGWILLALAIALVNAGSGLTALWVLLCVAGWALVLFFPVRWALHWFARRSGSIESGPTVFFMTVTMLLVFASAFFTDVIGVQAIFGGFLVGMIVPRDNGLAIALTEKLEDMVSIIFLPLYFTFSGLSTNLGLLNTGTIWGFVFAVVFTDWAGKFVGAGLTSRAVGFQWREAATIGSLMSCKGLVELIVLNIGLQAKILTQQVFSLFVLEALILTFATSPIVEWLYPPHLRVRAIGGEISNPRKERRKSMDTDKHSSIATLISTKTHFTIVLDKLEHLPSIMMITQLIRPASSSSSVVSEKEADHLPPVVDALRLIELSDRTSALMKSSQTDALMQADPLLSIFRTFGELNDVPVSSSLAVVTQENFATSVADHASDHNSDLVFIPWTPPSFSSAGASTVDLAGSASQMSAFDFFKASGINDNPSMALQSRFIRGVFSRSPVDVALFLDRRPTTESARHSRQHVILPFFGGPDDRLALEFVVQICASSKTTATIVRYSKIEGESESSVEAPSKTHIPDFGRHHEASMTFPDTVYGAANTTMRLQSETADNILWNNFTGPNVSPTPALSRIEFSTTSTPTPLKSVIELVSSEQARRNRLDGRLLIVTGRSRWLAVESHQAELDAIVRDSGGIGQEFRKTVGDVASALVVTGSQDGLIVMQAANVPT